MDWQTIISIIGPLGAFMAWTYSRIDKKFESMDKKFDAKFDKIDQEIKEIKGEMKEIRGEMKEIRASVYHIEGWLHKEYYMFLKDDKLKKAE